jgi:hypothetical protein
MRRLLALLVVCVGVLVAIPAVALAAQTLTAVTDPATSVGSTSATLHGSWTCDSGPSQCGTWFHYRIVGSTTWTSTSVVNIAAGSSGADSPATVTGLTPGDSYQFQACGGITGGTPAACYAPTLSFMTTSGSADETVTPEAADQLTSSGANLHANVICQSGAWANCGYWFKYWQDPSGSPTSTTNGNVQQGITKEVTSEISGLSASTTYDYQACGSITGYQTAACYGPTQSFKTLPSGGTQTITPTTSPPTGVTTDTAQLNGDFNCSAGASSCDWWFEWRQGTSGAWTDTLSQSMSAGLDMTQSAGISGLTAGTTYQDAACGDVGGGSPTCDLAPEVWNTQTGGTPIDGASNDTCSGTCSTPGTADNMSLTASDDNGNMISRNYSFWRPSNLQYGPTHLAPAILVFNAAGNCGLDVVGNWHTAAVTNKAVVVDMEIPCSRSPANWQQKWAFPDAGGGNGQMKPNDEPYVQDVIGQITDCPSSGATRDQCVDPQRVYAVGESSGGNMASDVMCDPTTAPLLRGVDIDSASLKTYTGQTDCPAAGTGPAADPDPNPMFAMLSLSNYPSTTDGALYNDTGSSPHLDINQSGQHFQNWFASSYGCSGSGTGTSLGDADRLGAGTNNGPDAAAATLRYREGAPCNNGDSSGYAVEALGVQNGGHGWTCQDSAPAFFYCPGMADPPGLDTTNSQGTGGNASIGAPWTDGLSIEQEFFNFVAQGYSG